MTAVMGTRASVGLLGAVIVGALACSSAASPQRSDGAAGTSGGDAASPEAKPAGASAVADAPTDRGAPDAALEAAPSARACATLALCDDFESAAVGGKPDPAKWTVGAPDVTGTGTLAIDDAQHHGGARAVRVDGQGGYSNHIFFSNSAVIGTLGPVVWGRFYVRFSDALGDGHLTFLAMKDAADGGKHLRMGGQAKILMWNRESDDATVPALSPTGIALSREPPPNQWLCVEYMIDGAHGFLQTWVDGAEVAGTHVDATPTPDVDDQWLRKADWRPRLTDFALGWESYAGQAMTLWFDDVALDATRVGCL
jgi:hypothetical protein